MITISHFNLIDVFFYYPSIDNSVVTAKDELGKSVDSSEFLQNLSTCCEDIFGNVFSNEYAKQLRSRAKRYGLSRPNSKPIVTSLAVIAVNEYIKQRRSTNKSDNSIGLLVCSDTALKHISYQFERVGTTQGWTVLDPFWLPNSIPTAISTSVFSTLNMPGCALTFAGGASGFFAALMQSECLFFSAAVDEIVILMAEQVTLYHEVLASHIGDSRSMQSGVAGIVLKPSDSKCSGVFGRAKLNRIELQDHRRLCNKTLDIQDCQCFDLYNYLEIPIHLFKVIKGNKQSRIFIGQSNDYRSVYNQFEITTNPEKIEVN